MRFIHIWSWIKRDTLPVGCKNTYYPLLFCFLLSHQRRRLVLMYLNESKSTLEPILPFLHGPGLLPFLAARIQLNALLFIQLKLKEANQVQLQGHHERGWLTLLRRRFNNSVNHRVCPTHMGWVSQISLPTGSVLYDTKKNQHGHHYQHKTTNACMRRDKKEEPCGHHISTPDGWVFDVRSGGQL